MCKRRLFFGLLICVLLLFTAACGGSSSGGSSSAGGNANSSGVGEPITVIMTHEVALNHAKHMKMEEFARKLEEKSGGRLKAELYPSGQLYTDPDAVAAMGTGSVHIAWPPSAILEALNEKVSIIGLPFALDDEVMLNNQGFKDDLNELISSLLEEKNIRFLGLLRATGGVLISTDKRLATAEDLAGLKVSVAGGQTQISIFENLGSTAFVMPISETPTAMAQGTVNAVHTSPSAWATGIGDVGKFGAVIPGIIPANYAMIVDGKWFNSLPEDLQQVIIEAANETATDYTQFSIDTDNAMLEEVKKFATVDYFTKEETGKVKEKMAPVIESFKQKFPEIYEKFEQIKKNNGVN